MKKYLMLFVLLTTLDQLTKEAMYNISGKMIGYSIPIINNLLNFTYVENHGGVFGLFQGSILIFTICASLVIGFLIYTEWKNFINGDIYTKLGYVFIASGAMGNMIDRIFRGFVIDMIDFRSIWQFVFNVADMYIHIGIYILIAGYFVNKKLNK